VLTVVEASVTDGVSATGPTPMMPNAKPPPRPASVLLKDDCTRKLKLLTGLYKFAAGVNFKPALPWANVINELLAIGVMPSFRNNVPLVIFVILKCVTSALSETFRVITSPEVV